MTEKIYPEIEVNFALVDNKIYHLNLSTFAKCNNGELIKVNERYTFPISDVNTLVHKIIEQTNRFHLMCQLYILKRK